MILGLLSLAPLCHSGEEPPLPMGLGEATSSTSSEPELPIGLESQAPSEEPALPAGLEDTLEPDEPSLPAGLGGPSEPALPTGLGSSTEPEEPALPQGLFKSSSLEETHPQESATSLPFDLSGFWEGRLGFRTQRDPYEKDVSIGETRLQLQVEKAWDRVSFKLTTDFLYDPVLDHQAIRLEKGDGFLDLREASLLIRPTNFMDVKIGRQIFTWGTGDLIFINDLFPKDWNAFFIGRDTEYLKAPSDALKVSLFSQWANLDVVYTPRFDTDRFIDGRRISFFNSQFSRRSGMDAIVRTELPDRWFDSDELAWRLYRNLGGYELAVYGYHGFWKSPNGFNPQSGRATFPVLSAYGASIRGAVGNGIGNMEVGYYDSEEDRRGNDPMVRNGEFRFLAGYEQEVATDFMVGVQYYLEFMLDHQEYMRTLPAGGKAKDEARHLLTLRLTKLLLNQNLRLSLFTFFSPSDFDAYLRPKVHYKINDHWSAEMGGNVFLGKDKHTFFSQFGKNSNVYVGGRYGF